MVWNESMVRHKPLTLAVSVVMGLALAWSVQAQDLDQLSRMRGLSIPPTSDEQQLRLARERRLANLEPNYADPNYYDVNDTHEPPLDINDLSPIELLLSGRAPNDVSMDIRQFGYDVFQRKVTTFAPITNIPVGPEYMVGPGDRFSITLWGRQNDQLTVSVGRDGKIVLPEVGVLTVAGMPFNRLQDYIESELKRKYTDFKMHISMERLRTVTVYVVGEAQTPGSYTLSALGTSLHALFSAGGPTKNGSLRNIRVIRAGQAVSTVDVYDLLLNGKTDGDIRLVDGDMIHIPLIGAVVGVAGNVRRPAIYEIDPEATLDDILALAGGVTHAGWLQHVQVERIENHARRTVVDFDLSGDMADRGPLDMRLQDGDVVKVYPVLERQEGVVFLDGHVIRPTKYQLRPDMRLADVLKDHRLFRPEVNLVYAQIERLIPPDLHRVVIPFHLGRLLAGSPTENKALQDMDTIRLFRWDEMGKRSVVISGAVYEPNEYPLVPDMRVKDLVDAAGGLRKDAYVLNAEITRHDVDQQGAATETLNVDLSRAMQYDAAHNLLLQDYDHIVVRPIPEMDINDVVIVSGEVQFPGAYPIGRTERLSSLLERAGGYTDEAYLRGAVFTRVSARRVQQQRVQAMVKDLEESVLGEMAEGVSKSADAESAQMQQAALEAKQELLARLRQAQASGRVVIHLDALEDFKGSAYDLTLEDGDEIVIPKTPGIVSVIGEVFNPTSLLYEEGQTVQFYLNRVGGIGKDADKKQISVIRADGSVISMAQKNHNRITWNSQTNQWTSGGFLNASLDPGDTIVVPRKLDRIFWLKNTKDITQIIFQMALAVGVVLAI
jgi:protein involved in polysaccharide export with SLBB domain